MELVDYVCDVGELRQDLHSRISVTTKLSSCIRLALENMNICITCCQVDNFRAAVLNVAGRKLGALDLCEARLV